LSQSTNIVHNSRVRAVSGELNTELYKQFGIAPGTITRALLGNLDAAEFLGVLGQQGQTIIDNADMVQNATLAAIEGKTRYAEVTSAIAQAAGNGSTRISAATDAAELANIKFTDQRVLQIAKLETAKGVLDIKRAGDQQLIDMQSKIALHVAKVDTDYKLLQAQIGIEVKDVDQQYQHKKERFNQLITQGNRAISGHKPIKQYGAKPLLTKINEAWEAVKSTVVGQ
jgi:hypothetical protein